MNEVDSLAKKIWDYMHMNHRIEKADCILVLGSHDIRVAERGAQLFLEGWAPLIVFSGKRGALTQHWKRSEAEIFADVAIKMGVPKDKILLEKEATNTGENITLTRKLLKEKGIRADTLILVQKPYMERRTYATCKKFWPEVDIIVTSPQISFEKYPTAEISKEDIINIMVGDLQRIKEYPAKGFQIPQEIPEDVWSAYEKLVKLGYTKHLIKVV